MSVQVKTVFTRIAKGGAKRSLFPRLKHRLLSLPYWLAAHRYRTPGLYLHKEIVKLALKLWRGEGRRTRGYRELATLPLDSVRYFEFDFLWGAAQKSARGRYLDVSSPRLFPLLLLRAQPSLSATLVNPDLRDLQTSRDLYRHCGVDGRCQFLGELMENLELEAASFDLISSISVIEHIPGFGDLAAVRHLWRLLKPGGRLLLSVPCAREPFEEHLDHNEYGLLPTGPDAFVFGQRFYDDALLAERIFSVTGPPAAMGVYGEKTPGFCVANREEKTNNHGYPFWREPYMTGCEFARFPSIDALPGWGVVAMEFCKAS